MGGLAGDAEPGADLSPGVAAAALAKAKSAESSRATGTQAK
jgi:hypothetical protein